MDGGGRIERARVGEEKRERRIETKVTEKKIQFAEKLKMNRYKGWKINCVYPT